MADNYRKYKRGGDDGDIRIASGKKPSSQSRKRPIDDDEKTRVIDRSELAAERRKTERSSPSKSSGTRKSGSYSSSSSSSHRNGQYRKYTKQEKKKYMRLKKKQQNGCLRKILYFIVIFTVSLFFAIYAVKVSSDMFGLFQEDSAVEITVPKNATDEQIVTLLKENNIIEYEWAFNLYSKLKKSKNPNVAGVYVLNRKDDYGTIINTVKGAYLQREEITVVIPEGYTFEQICKELEKQGVCKASEMKAYADKIKSGYDFLDKMPDDDNIIYRFEGYMFPDTYTFYSDSPASSVYAKFLTNMEQKFDSKYQKKASEKGMSMHEVLTLASIIQKEAGEIDEMKKVSSVFNNRLNSRGLRKLQSDVTVWYPYATRDDVEDINAFKGTYNTYDLEGLPPGPVCNPGLEAIDAALNPDSTNYYYFVTDKNNVYYYAETFEQHKYNCSVAASVGVTGGTGTEE